MQGYITLATGSQYYVEMAINLILSLKLNDPTRPVCLVTDRETVIPEQYLAFIDNLVYLEHQSGFHGCLNKLRINQVSPYDETLFIDADCILVKNDMDRHWQKHQSKGFSIAGGKTVNGQWYSFSIADVLAKLNIKYMVQMNSGVFYFRKGSESERFFNTALELVDQQKDLLGTFHRNKLQLADEPFIGATMGMLSIEPLAYQAREGTIMITTWRASKATFDPFLKSSTITKHGDFRFLGRFLPRSSVLHSPSLPHFVKLKPKKMYNQLARQLRNHFGIANFDF